MAGPEVLMTVKASSDAAVDSLEDGLASTGARFDGLRLRDTGDSVDRVAAIVV